MTSNNNDNHISWRLQKLKERQLQVQQQQQQQQQQKTSQSTNSSTNNSITTSATSVTATVASTPSSATSMKIGQHQSSFNMDDSASLSRGEVLSTYVNQNPMIKHNRFSSASSSSSSSFGMASNSNMAEDEYSRRNSQISTSSSTTTSSVRSNDALADYSKKCLGRGINGHNQESLRIL